MKDEKEKAAFSGLASNPLYAGQERRDSDAAKGGFLFFILHPSSFILFLAPSSLACSSFPIIDSVPSRDVE